MHGIQVTGGFKLDPHSGECHFLGYATGVGNYKVQDVTSHCMFVSHDLVFEEGHPCHTLPSVGEQINLFNFDNINDNTSSNTNSTRQ